MKPHFIVFPLLLAGLTACGGSNVEPLPSPSVAPVSSSPATPTPSASPSPVSSPSPSVEETFKFNPSGYSKDQQDAVATVKELLHFADLAGQDPSQPIQRLSEIADGEFLTLLISDLVAYEQAGLVARGTAQYEVLKVEPAREIDGEEWVRVYVCSDNRGTWIADHASGEKVDQADSPFTMFRMDVRKSNGLWRVPVSAGKHGERCEL